MWRCALTRGTVLLVTGVKFERFWSCMEVCSLSFLLIGLRCREARMALDVWSLTYAPGVSVFPAHSGFKRKDG